MSDGFAPVPLYRLMPVPEDVQPVGISALVALMVFAANAGELKFPLTTSGAGVGVGVGVGVGEAVGDVVGFDEGVAVGDVVGFAVGEVLGDGIDDASGFGTEEPPPPHAARTRVPERVKAPTMARNPLLVNLIPF